MSYIESIKQSIQTGIRTIVTLLVPIVIVDKILEKIGLFLFTVPQLYYTLAFIVLFIFWYGFFELAKK
jgi:hypothetical protein